jgi:hypothetical protein
MAFALDDFLHYLLQRQVILVRMSVQEAGALCFISGVSCDAANQDYNMWSYMLSTLDASRD